MSNLTLDQVGILERLQAAEAACQEAAEMIGYHPTNWNTGRSEGRATAFLDAADAAISRALAALTIGLNWK